MQNAQSDDDPALTLYAMGYQTYYSVDVTFKVNNPDTLSFKSGNTTERTITFRKYWNTELDYSANGDMVDPTGKDIYPCELNDEAWDNNPDDMNCKDDPGLTFTGEWAFYSGGFNGAGDTGYEKEGEGNNVNIPVTYATISDIWKKVFENYDLIIAAHISKFFGMNNVGNDFWKKTIIFPMFCIINPFVLSF